MPENPQTRQFCENLANLLRQERERKKLSRAVVGKRAKLSAQTILRVERGQCDPAFNSFIRIADALEIAPAKILAQAEKLQQ